MVIKKLTNLIFFIGLLSVTSCQSISSIEVDLKDSETKVPDVEEPDNTPPEEEVLPPTDPAPTPPSIYSNLSQKIFLGINSNSCGFSSTGQIKCWGGNHDPDDWKMGLLGIGDGTTTAYDTPQDVNIGTMYTSVSIGEYTACAVTNTGQGQCWGASAAVGDSTYAGGDVLIPRDINDTDPYLSITSGSYHNCGITIDNTLKCWGDSWGGKLGRVGNNKDPLTSDPGTTYSRVGAGRNHTCGITADKKLKCFGHNSNGQIGVGNTTSPQTPTIIDPGIDYDFISAQEDNTCAITSASKLKCWGANSNGQVGDGGTSTVNSPTLIDGTVDYKWVEVGNRHTCAITTADKLKCWGLNSSGQIGDNSTVGPVLTPKEVDGGNSYKEVSTGGAHTCGLRLNGDLFCWGANSRGQLGDNSTTQRLVPTQVILGFN